MLTNKQMWRKSRYQGVNLRRSISDDAVCGAFNSPSDSGAETDIAHRNSCSSLDSMSGGEGSPVNGISCSQQVEDLHLPQGTIRKIKKKLRFDNLVRVTLIPSINEYKAAGLHLFLWCSQNELQCYKDSAYEDIKEFMRVSNCDNFSQAMKSLFQVDYTNMAEELGVADAAHLLPPTPAEALRAEAPPLPAII